MPSSIRLVMRNNAIGFLIDDISGDNSLCVDRLITDELFPDLAVTVEQFFVKAGI